MLRRLGVLPRHHFDPLKVVEKHSGERFSAHHKIYTTSWNFDKSEQTRATDMHSMSGTQASDRSDHDGMPKNSV
jgi:hypothetical protein